MLVQHLVVDNHKYYLFAITSFPDFVIYDLIQSLIYHEQMEILVTQGSYRKRETLEV